MEGEGGREGEGGGREMELVDGGREREEKEDAEEEDAEEEEGRKLRGIWNGGGGGGVDEYRGYFSQQLTSQTELVG